MKMYVIFGELHLIQLLISKQNLDNLVCLFIPIIRKYNFFLNKRHKSPQKSMGKHRKTKSKMAAHMGLQMVQTAFIR